ncbi:hypothetical protein ABZ816_26650 [Actinosynnema sp. NPDC047251]|uniref:hypothetical protein n=1 Tax=Saccharothrix espanaensis TaxID=103731 RepID=UPI0018D39D78|nr:hypothetical protein [Saccharothrix espanaensis]
MVAKCRHVPTTRARGARAWCSGAGSSAVSTATNSCTGRISFSAIRSSGSPAATASAGWMTSPCAAAQIPTGSSGRLSTSRSCAGARLVNGPGRA